jgi:hypothetical protein
MITPDTIIVRPRTFLNDDGRIVLVFEGVLEVLMTPSQTDVIASRLFEVAQSARLLQAKREMAAQFAKLDGVDRPDGAKSDPRLGSDGDIRATDNSKSRK